MVKPPKISHYSCSDQRTLLLMSPNSTPDSLGTRSSDPSADAARPQGIQHGSHVTLHFRLMLGDGQVVFDTFDDHPATIEVGEGQISPALERCLIALNEGDERSYELGPDDAFGPRNPELIQRVSKALLDEHSDPEEPLAAGDIVEFPGPEGSRFAGIFKGWEGGGAVFDFNHPLAGQSVKFDVRIIGLL
jgi:FKBP-type peptidyl-prolyl cis-trans isomerase SlpA